MPRKVFNVTVEFDLHAVTCPGVWLCPKGKVSLRILMLDSSTETSDLEPAFPLLVHETFTFSHTFRRVRYLQDLAHLFSGQLLSIQLIQWGESLTAGNILATFDTSLEELLYPAPPCRALLPGVDVDLLMEPTEVFPGIIAPKVEVSTRTTIEEALTSSICGDGDSVFPKTLLSKTAGTQNKRQRRVCHTRGVKAPGRLAAHACLVRRDRAWRSAAVPCSEGDKSIASLTSLQRLIWEATSRDIRGPLTGTPTQRGHPCCLREKSPNADTGVGTPSQRRSKCYHETLERAETVVPGKERPNDFSANQGRLAGEMSQCQAFGSKDQRNASHGAKGPRVGCSGGGRETERNGSWRRKARRASPVNETRHNVTPRSTLVGSRPSSRSRAVGDTLGPASRGSSPSRRSPHGARTRTRNACACMKPSQHGDLGSTDRCSGQRCDCYAGVGQGDAGRQPSSLRRPEDPCASARTAIRSRRGGVEPSYRESFYRNLEKFYKRLYDQAMERKSRCSC